MATYTSNLNLYMPDSTDDFGEFREEHNDNMVKIDNAIGGGGGSGGHTIIDPNGNSLPQESGLQFTGGVTVTDDSVNGKTVVDISGSSVVELTQAQYEALPDSKLTDDILYGLKDVKSFLDADILYLGTCYSTSERMVGCWIDGKPLYQKTIEYSGTLAENTWIAFGTIGSNENIVGMKGILTATSDNVSYIIGGYRMNEVACTLCSTVDHFELWYRRAGYSCDKITLTYQYTKTTDIAGSGTWTPSGVNAVHYDTNEQVIGTYLGKTLYEKTFNVGTASFDSNLQISITNGLSNIEYIVDYGGSAKEPRDNRNIPLPYFRKSWNESIVPQIMQLPDRTVSMAIVTNDSFYTSLQNIVLWVRYTKSS